MRTTMRMPPTKMNQSLTKKSAIEMSARVGRGSLAWSEVKNVLNRGRTKAVMTTTATIDSTRTITG